MKQGSAYRKLEEAVRQSPDRWVQADAWLAAHDEEQERRYGRLGRDRSLQQLLREDEMRLASPL